MSNDESLDLQGQQKTRSIHPDAEDWGGKFAWTLELEYSNTAAQLPDGASSVDFRRAMLTAVVNVLGESGAKPEEIAQLLEECIRPLSLVKGDDEWTSEKNGRRLELIDKFIQQTLSPEEAVELERLTEQMRSRYDTEEMVPLEGARRLHRQLLENDDAEHTPT